MKRILLCLIILMTCSISCKRGKNHYQDSIYNFSIDYPEGWRQNKEYEFAAVAFVPQIRENNEILSVIIEDIPGKMTEEEYIKKSKQLLSAGITDFKLMGDGKIDEKKNSFYMDYKGSFGGVKLHWYQRFIIRNKRVHVITYAAKPDGYSKYIDVIKSSMDSYEIEEKSK